MHRRGLNRRQCMLNMLNSVGCAGMVLFMQVASWYFVYFLTGLLSYPLFMIVALGAYVILFVFLTASTALLLLPCVTGCRRCPQQSVPIMFLITIALLCSGFTYLLTYVRAGKWHTSYKSNQIVSGIFVSGILVLLSYTLKSAFAQNILTSGSQGGTDDLHKQILNEQIQTV